MKSKVLKIGTVLLACVCLISFMAIPVSAATQNVGYNNLYVWDFLCCDGLESNLMGDVGDDYDIRQLDLSSNNLWSNSIYISFADGGPILDYTNTGEIWETGICLNFSKAGSYEFDVAYQGLDPYRAELIYGREDEIDLEFIDMGIRQDGENDYWYTCKIKVDIKVPSDRYEFFIVSEQTTNAEGVHELILYGIQYSANETQTIIDNQNQNANEIMENQNENTDKILNDWDGGVDVDDGTKDDFANAEDAALGGKTDEEIQEEIDNALDFDISVFDSNKVGKMHHFFDNVLNACGTSYKSVLMLSLTMGLAAFLIGRRYG